MMVKVTHDEVLLFRINIFHSQFARLKESFKDSPFTKVELENKHEGKDNTWL